MNICLSFKFQGSSINTFRLDWGGSILKTKDFLCIYEEKYENENEHGLSLFEYY